MPPKKRARTEVELDRTLRRDEAPTRTPSPPSTNPGGTPVPPGEDTSSHTPLAVTEASTSSGPGVCFRAEPEKWENLERLMETLKQATGISGLESLPVKTVIEGLVDLIGLYEDAGQGRKEFDDLRLQLECIFDEFAQHLSFSPTMTTSMDSICWSIQKEIQFVKTRQARPRKRNSGEVNGDACDVLDCYRRIQDHLQRLTRNANIKTWQIVDQLATDHRLEKLAPSLWACYNSEKANELKRRSCTQGTRTNVLAQMHQWVTGKDTGNLYWMSGMAGTGKTTIAYSLCEQLDDRTNQMLCASFFCSRSLPECRDVGRIIPSIAYQLAHFSRPLRYALSQATEKDPLAYTRLPPMQFDSLIMEPLSNNEVRKTLPTSMVVVIDALDECDDVKSTKQILDVLLTKSKDLPIKFLVSSRPEPAIRERMEKNGTWVDTRVVLHELDSGEVKTDIKTYLKAELDPIKPSELDIDQLVARAGVLFIYAATVIRYIGYDDFGRNPRARLKAVLAKTSQHVKAQTKDIDELYGIVLKAAFEDPSVSEEEQDDMKLILDTVICAREPLTVSALSKLLQLNDVERVHAALRPLWSVLHVMGPNMTVTTLHASFPDYLLDSKRSGAWHCNAAARHHLIAQRCFECIGDTKPQFNICRLESSYLLDKEVPDLDTRVERFISTELRYACLYWSSHLSAAEPGSAPDLMRLLSIFLSTHLLLWLEVRNLTKFAPTTVGELMDVQQWANQHRINREVIDLLSDAWYFAYTFVSNLVSQSTPHLYVSMLSLLSPSSPVFKHYSHRCRGMIKVEGTALPQREHAPLAQWKFDLSLDCMTCSPDGTRVAISGYTTSQVGRLFVLDAFTGNLLLDLSPQGNNTIVDSIAFSPDGTRLVSHRQGGAFSVWDVTTGQTVLSPFSAYSGPAQHTIYSHDGSSIIFASGEKIIRIWDAPFDKRTPTTLLGHTKVVTCIAISSDDALLVSGSRDNTIRVWDLQSGKTTLDSIRLRPDHAMTVALTPDGSFIVSGSYYGTIHMWDIQNGQMVLDPLRKRSQSEERVFSVSISPNGASIASTSFTDRVQIWDAASGRFLSRLGPFSHHDSDAKWATYSPDGARIILACLDGTVRILDSQTATTASNLPPGHTDYIESIDISPDCRRIVSGSGDCNLFIWDLSQGNLLAGPLKGHLGPVNMVRFSPNGSRIVSCDFGSTICQWDSQSGAVRGAPIYVESRQLGGVVSATYSPDGTRIVSLTCDGNIAIWNSIDGRSILGPITTPGGNGRYAQFSPDGATVIAGSGGESIGMWDAQSGQLVYSCEGHWKLDMYSFAFSPDGLYYAQSFRDKKIGVGHVRTGEQIPGLFEGHTSNIWCVRFSPDGTQLVSAAGDGTVHAWGVDSGRSLFGPLKGHTDGVGSVAFSPDGNYVVSGSSDMSIRVWDIQPKAPLSKDQDVEYADWVLDEDGWVVSGEARRLFWVPTDLDHSLMRPRNTALISPNGYLRLSFEGALIGKAWADCWHNS